MKNCILHGKCNHNTKDFRTFSTILEKERAKIKTNMNRLVSEEGVDMENEGMINKKEFIYSYNVNYYSNPFIISCRINNKRYVALVDTGADISLILHSIIDGKYQLKPYNGIVKSACGNSLRIYGKIEH
jgi:hypothetical protein